MRPRIRNAPGRPAGGFTLIELMVVVTVMAILAVIALPAYQNYALRANRAVGKTVVVQIAAQEEGWYVDRKQYATTLQTLGYPGTAGSAVYFSRDARPSATKTADSIYSVSLTGASATAYTVVATAINRQAKDTTCLTLRADNLGNRTDSSSSGTECWR
jgi:type IV pilus assembly protein PilE